MISTFLDLTIRVGCHLTYEATAPTPVVFMLRPRLDDAHLVTVEKRSFEPDLPSNEFQDSHGNLACSMLKPGHNDIRYDALASGPRRFNGRLSPLAAGFAEQRRPLHHHRQEDSTGALNPATPRMRLRVLGGGVFAPAPNGH